MLEARRSVALRYVAVVAAGAAGSTLVNRAAARADGGNESNSASAAVLLREELFTSVGLLLGRVFAGTCDTTVDAGEGVAGVRVYLEDGRYAVTDDEGKYHFEGVTPGSHVVQLDPITLPESSSRCAATRACAAPATRCRSSSTCAAARSARPTSWLPQRAAPTGDARLSLDDGAGSRPASSTRPRSRRAPCRCDEAEVLVLLPEALAYVPGSAARDGAPGAEPARLRTARCASRSATSQPTARRT